MPIRGPNPTPIDTPERMVAFTGMRTPAATALRPHSYGLVDYLAQWVLFDHPPCKFPALAWRVAENVSRSWRHHRSDF
jgi:hypothetical protein